MSGSPEIDAPAGDLGATSDLGEIIRVLRVREVVEAREDVGRRCTSAPNNASIDTMATAFSLVMTWSSPGKW